ncbi:hypothetical protein M5689_012021 [Euphorbia peplus]|nr:hypothetical protein M5689_012021 [Euphorbia peplus]
MLKHQNRVNSRAAYVQRNMAKNTIKASIDASPASKNKPQKLWMLRLFEETEVFGSGHVFGFPNHVSSIFFILAPSFTISNALDMSRSRGDPLARR